MQVADLPEIRVAKRRQPVEKELLDPGTAEGMGWQTVVVNDLEFDPASGGTLNRVGRGVMARRGLPKGSRLQGSATHVGKFPERNSLIILSPLKFKLKYYHWYLNLI
jgi:hypothetical protein